MKKPFLPGFYISKCQQIKYFKKTIKKITKYNKCIQKYIHITKMHVFKIKNTIFALTVHLIP